MSVIQNEAMETGGESERSLIFWRAARNKCLAAAKIVLRYLHRKSVLKTDILMPITFSAMTFFYVDGLFRFSQLFYKQ